MSTPETSPVESVDRALLLIILMRDHGAISVKTAAEHLGVAASTAHRLLSALVFRGFARQNGERRYRLGPMLADPAAERFSIGKLREAAREPLRELHNELGETVQLMVLREGDIQFIDGIESESSLRVGMRIGDRMPAFVSAGGKAILAHMNNAELEHLYRDGLPEWPTSRITTMSMLKRSMTTVRRTQFGSNFEETEQGVSGVGVSINYPAGQPMAAITVATPSIRFKRETMAVHVAALREAAAAIEAHAGE